MPRNSLIILKTTRAQKYMILRVFSLTFNSDIGWKGIPQ